MDDDFGIPLSQLANEAFNPTLPHGDGGGGGAAPGPTDFSGQFARAGPHANGAAADVDAAGPGPGSSAASPAPRLVKGGKLFQDPIHGAFRLAPVCTHIFDSRQFQRLRRLKQLGLTYMVFPGVRAAAGSCAARQS